MQNFVTVAKIPYLFRPDLREFKIIDHTDGLTVGGAIFLYKKDLEKLGFRDFEILRNGCEVIDLNERTNHDDFISISVKHGIPVPAVIFGIEITASMAAVIGGFVNSVILMGIGLLIQSLLPPPTVKNAPNESPTYGFSQLNSTKEGNPVPRVVGNEKTIPQIIGSYRRVPNAGSGDYNMWLYVLLALTYGETNNPITASQVYLGEELLSSYTDYYFGVTSGKINPDSTDEAILFDKFSNIWHDRSFDRKLTYSLIYLEPVAAKGTMTVINVGAFSYGDTFTIGVQTWTFVDTRNSAFQVEVGLDISTTTANIQNAFSADGVTAFSWEAGGEVGQIIITWNTPGSIGNITPFTYYNESPMGDDTLSLDGGGYLGGTQQGIDASDLTGLFHVSTRGYCNSVIIIIEFLNGKFLIDENGDYLDRTVDIFYGYRKTDVGGPLIYTNIVTLAGKSMQIARFEIEIDFPSSDKYDVFVHRMTIDDPVEEEDKMRSSSYLTVFMEKLSIFQNYPGIQCCVIGIKGSEKISGQIPTISVIQNITSISVRNWTDTGLMTVNPSNNAWCAYEAFTDPYIGRNISPTKLLSGPWEEWYTWCEQTVDGYYRCRINMVFDELKNFADQLKYIEEVGRAKISQIGDYWTVLIKKPKTTVSYSFSSGNILPNSFNWEGYEDPEKIDAIEITYKDKDKLFQDKSVFKEASWYETLETLPNIAKIELRGCNNRNQALREAILRIQETEMLTRYGKLSALIGAIGVQNNDLVTIVHPTNKYSFSGRLGRDIHGESQLYLDQKLILSSADYSGKAKIFLVDFQGTYVEYTILGPYDEETRIINIDGTFVGKQFDIFSIGRPTEEKLFYLITNKKIIPSSGKQQDYVMIEFNEYVDTIYYNSSFGSGGTVPL